MDVRNWNPWAPGGNGAAIAENSMKFPPKLNRKLPFDPAIPLLGIHTKELKAEPQTDICTPVFTAALFTIAERWKQPECAPVDEWINKTWYICTVGCQSSLEKKTILG